MDINLTLFAEIITFAVLVWATMKYIWPPLVKTLDDRAEKIAAGIAMNERAQHTLAVAQEKAKKILKTARDQHQKIITRAQKEATESGEKILATAKQDSEKVLAITHAKLETEKYLAEQELQRHLSLLASQAAEKILENKFDTKADKILIDKFISTIATLADEKGEVTT